MTDDGRLVIRTGALVDVIDGAVIRGAPIVVRGDRIEAVLPDGAPVPEDARLLELDGLTVVPGLIDCHAHLVGDLEMSWIPAITTSAAQEAFTGVRNARDTLMAGFTTVRDLGTYRAFVDVALRHAINRGIVPGPRMAVAGAYVTVPGGGGALTGLAPDIELPLDLRFGMVTSPADVRRVVRALLHGGADLIKVIATGAALGSGLGGAIVGFGAAAGWEPAAAIAIAFAVTFVVGAGGVALSRRLLPASDPGVAARS